MTRGTATSGGETADFRRTRPRSLRAWFGAALIATLAHVPASADEAGRPDGEARASAAQREGPRLPSRDFRWSDGPRRVREPRNASLERMRALELGTREAGRKALRGELDARWIAAVRGESPGESLQWPVDDGRFGRGVGFVRRIREEQPHRGVDFASPRGATVRAAADGIVVYADNGLRGYGNVVVLAHANGWVTLYAHNQRVTVPAGYRVRRGERIALVGSTGLARGPHLHFELRERGRYRDPMPLLRRGKATSARTRTRMSRDERPLD